ncbi:MAG: CDP-alcohol phosphatidyltransferase family protein [Bacteroidia bacterium]|nr:CDP-alcohol phosphatidyltransferase family protein [Bacteroidia bacterium]
MKRRLKWLPNALTSVNLLAGFAAICVPIFADEYGMEPTRALRWSAALILFAAFFDFADGMAARALGAASDLGKQLDSLSDMVAFGAAPGVLMAAVVISSIHEPVLRPIALGSCALLPLAAAFRLARFNVNPPPHSHFVGLPTPAMGIFVAALALGRNSAIQPLNEIYRPTTIALFNVVLAALMVSNLPMMSLKPDFSRTRAMRLRAAFVLAVGFALGIWGFAVAPLALIAYVAISFAEARLMRDERPN